jgi:hypothetical protein
VQTATPSGLVVQSDANAAIASYFHPDIPGQTTQLEGASIFVRPPPQTFNFTLPEITGQPPEVTSGITLSRSNSGGNSSSATLTINNASLFDAANIVWLFGAEEDLLGTGTQLEINLGNYAINQGYNIIGVQTIFVQTYVSGAGFFGANVTFTVVP